MEALTAQQKRVLEFIRTYARNEGMMPTFRDIADHFGFRSPTAATDHVKALVRKNALESRPGLARSFRIVSKLDSLRKQVIDVPIFGSIPAGFARDSEQEAIGCLSIDAKTLGSRSRGRTFALEVRGDSMIGKHIMNGDYVILEQGRTPRTGEVVAALIDNESTLKTYISRHGKHGKPVLRAENPKYPNFIPASDLTIQGVMVALVRQV